MHNTNYKLKNEEKERFLAHLIQSDGLKKKDEKPTFSSFSLSNNTAGGTVGLDSAGIVNHNLWKVLMELTVHCRPFHHVPSAAHTPTAASKN